MATYRLRRKLYGVGDAVGTAAGGALQTVGGLADTTLGGAAGGLYSASKWGSAIGDALGIGGVGGALAAGAIGYGVTRGLGKTMKNVGDDLQ